MQPATPADLLRRWQTEGPRPRTLQAVVDWVARAIRTRKPEEAVALLRALLEAREDPVLWGYLAQAETAAGHADKAAVALVRHLQAAESPEPAVWVAAVDAFVEAGRPDRAKALAERADPAELKAFLLQRLKQDTGRTPRPKALKTMKALAALERGTLMQVLSNLPLETVAAAVGAEGEVVRDAILECFSGGPKRRLSGLMGRETGKKDRDAAKKTVLAAAKAVR
jgi:hypothetical protein